LARRSVTTNGKEMERVSIETELAAWVYKLLWIPVVGPILAWLVKKVVTDVYTKSEVKEQIEARVKPIEVVISHLNKSIEKQIEATERLTTAIGNLDKRISIEETKRRGE
jgi:uncharacterized Tic20 family protein